jgi:hypothetical protein
MVPSWFRQWVKGVFGAGHKAPQVERRPRSGFRPALEALEDRRLLSVIGSAIGTATSNYGVGTPGVAVASVATPSLKVASVATPSVATQTVATPSVKVASVTTPTVATPSVATQTVVSTKAVSPATAPVVVGSNAVALQHPQVVGPGVTVAAAQGTYQNVGLAVAPVPGGQLLTAGQKLQQQAQQIADAQTLASRLFPQMVVKSANGLVAVPESNFLGDVVQGPNGLTFVPKANVEAALKGGQIKTQADLVAMVQANYNAFLAAHGSDPVTTIPEGTQAATVVASPDYVNMLLLLGNGLDQVEALADVPPAVIDAAKEFDTAVTQTKAASSPVTEPTTESAAAPVGVSQEAIPDLAYGQLASGSLDGTGSGAGGEATTPTADSSAIDALEEQRAAWYKAHYDSTTGTFDTPASKATFDELTNQLNVLLGQPSAPEAPPTQDPGLLKGQITQTSTATTPPAQAPAQVPTETGDPSNNALNGIGEAVTPSAQVLGGYTVGVVKGVANLVTGGLSLAGNTATGVAFSVASALSPSAADKKAAKTLAEASFVPAATVVNKAVAAVTHPVPAIDQAITGAKQTATEINTKAVNGNLSGSGEQIGEVTVNVLATVDGAAGIVSTTGKLARAAGGLVTAGGKDAAETASSVRAPVAPAAPPEVLPTDVLTGLPQGEVAYGAASHNALITFLNKVALQKMGQKFSQLTPELQRQYLAMINKYIAPINPLLGADGTLTNCFNCAVAQIRTWQGAKTSALPGTVVTDAVVAGKVPANQPAIPTAAQPMPLGLKQLFGASIPKGVTDPAEIFAHQQGIPIGMTPSEIADSLRQAGNGSDGIVFTVSREANGTIVQHVVTVRNENGVVQFNDPQLGQPANFTGLVKSYFYRVD